MTRRRLGSGALALLTFWCSRAAPARNGDEDARDDTVQTMTEAARALLTAHDALDRRFPGRRFGNIVVEPTGDSYQVTLVDLPGVDPGKQTVGSGVVTVDRRSGEVTATKDVAVAVVPYQTLDLPGPAISGRQAFDAALAAIKGYETYDKHGKLTVELVDRTYRVTFPLPAAQKQPRGADYAFQVWIDATDGRVIKILTAS